MGEFVRVAGTADVKPGHGIVAEVQGKTLAVFNVDGTFHAIDNTCVHRGGPLGEGEVEGGVVSCPWHGWQFNVATGECVKNPSAKVAVYQVKVDGDEVKVLI
ncbi:Rieske (2Fe-2S) protein [Nitrospira moscoviensis]|uniref:Dioxygenase, ferredoxin subunit n=1 Tax=Nitrospira moscoviensis TaxID=42253 RepID=A0A0K2GC00_NITMO|nr:Rieske 2Fe-2S domain-containing protein [Nitrospira moscoviensis]ALA58481.1 Dioxygenase, ferredoxin subunit [Nitrospira moscoviensis]